MAKVVLIFILVYTFTNANSLDKKCLSCHQKQQIPSELIYKRYLLKYSTKQAMQKEIFDYLKHPSKKNSIMPPQFFLKFPMKEESSLQDKKLQKLIEAFLQRYDIKKRLVIP